MNLFEKVLELSGYNIKKADKEIAELNTLATSDFKIWEVNKRWEIVNYHYKTNPFYQKFFTSEINNNWGEIPVLKKAMIQRPLAEMLNPQFQLKDCYVSNTSGSSGTPLFFAKNNFAHAMTWSIIKNRYQLHNISFNSKQARFYGIPLNKVSYLKERLKDKIMNRYRFTIFNLSDDILLQYLNKFKTTKFRYIYGYTNSMVLFARFLVKNNIDLKRDFCNSLEVCIATSEQCTDEDKQLLEKAFGISVIREYGVSESDFIAINDNFGRWIISNELVYVEIVDDNYELVEDGIVGKILITSLHNQAMPFIRYEVGDLGSIKRNKEYKHDELLTLNGRLNDIAYLPSGKTVPGFTLYYVSRQILEKSGVLKEYTIRQTALDTFIFEVVTDNQLNENDIQLIKNTMYQYLENGINIEIKKVNKIERQASGKLKHFHSLIKKD